MDNCRKEKLKKNESEISINKDEKKKKRMTLVLVRILERQTGPNPRSRDVLKLGKKADWTKPNQTGWFGLVL